MNRMSGASLAQLDIYGGMACALRRMYGVQCWRYCCSYAMGTW